MFALTLLVALPLAIASSRHDRGAPRRQPGGRAPSPAATDYDWWQEFTGPGAGPGHDVRPVDRRLRRRARQRQRVPRQPADGGHDRRRDDGVDGDLVVPERRRDRSLRATAADARGRILCRLRHQLLAVSPARHPRLARLRRAVRDRPPMDLRHPLPGRDRGRDRRAHRTRGSRDLLRHLRNVPGCLQPGVRLRPHPDRGGGSAQRDRRPDRRRRGSCAGTRRRWRSTC